MAGSKNKDAEFIRAIKAQKSGKKVDEEPEEDTDGTYKLSGEESFYWRCFNALTVQREQGSNGPAPLRIVDVTAYAQAQLVTRYELSLFLEIILEMDYAYLQIVYKNIAEERRRQERRDKGRRRG